MLNFKFGLSALLMEVAAWSGPLFLSDQSDIALAGYLLIHAIASVLLAFFALPLLMQDTAKPRWAVLSLIAVASYAVPLGGFIGVISALLVLRFYRSKEKNADFESVQLPEFDLHQRSQGGFRQAGLRSFLSNPDVPVRSRMKAMVALQYVSSRLSTPLLRKVLNDPSEDLRMLAYGMIDNQELRINRSIDYELGVLRAGADSSGAPTTASAVEAAEHLAELYWELVYQELAQGDLRQHAIHESLRYGQMVLAQQPNHTLLWLQRGRLLQNTNTDSLEEASACYEKALTLGIPETRVLPYQAELKFKQRDFAAVQTIMNHLNAKGSLPRLRSVIEYWDRA